MELNCATDGSFRLDGGSMFGIVPKPLWSKIDPADDRNRILIALNSLLIKTGKENILVDTGLGQNRDERFKDLYDLDCGLLVDSIESYGIGVNEINTVILTHLHFDHAGGATFESKDGTINTRFPNARHVIQKGEWEDAHNTNEITKGSYIEEHLDALEKNGQVELVEGDSEVSPGIRTVVTGGHTRCHQIVLIETGGQTCIYWGDLVPMALHVNMAYIMSYDLYPLETLEQKKQWISKSISGSWLNFFEHDPKVTFARLTQGRKRVNVNKVDIH